MDSDSVESAYSQSGVTRSRRERRQRKHHRPPSTSAFSTSAYKETNDWVPACLVVEYSKLTTGMTIASLAATLLTTIFSVFHVDVFLRAYQLPLATYSLGNFIFSILNTANNLLGAWIVDDIATSRQRTDLVGVAGIVFVICFLTPFFRWWKEPLSQAWDASHFMLSLALYDSTFSFTAILMGSVVTDNIHMNDIERVQFVASGKVINLVASFVVTRIGLELFDADNLINFRLFLILIACISAALFVLGQVVIRGSSTSWANLPSEMRWSSIIPRRRYHYLQNSDNSPTQEPDNYKKSDDGSAVHWQWRRVLHDLWRHKNFRAWIGMEMLLEAQMTFISFFLKTFVDELLLKTHGLSHDKGDWLISMTGPLIQIAAICAYIPMQTIGYQRIYTAVFVFNLIFSTTVFLLADASRPLCILIYLVLYPTFTGGIQVAGFYLAMSDMVLELKRDRAIAGRLSEPSMAGLFMGANALLCKPMESFLPMIAATLLNYRREQNEDGDSEAEPTSMADVWFGLLVLPPAIFSVLQLWSWSRYDLTPIRTARMREELQKMLAATPAGPQANAVVGGNGSGEQEIP